jgi:hypothetical protein
MGCGIMRSKGWRMMAREDHSPQGRERFSWLGKRPFVSFHPNYKHWRGKVTGNLQFPASTIGDIYLVALFSPDQINHRPTPTGVVGQGKPIRDRSPSHPTEKHSFKSNSLAAPPGGGRAVKVERSRRGERGAASNTLTARP